ncbi:MAG: multicopper oxidase domain-containing protein [Okeania sp. SIO3I5]|uniref:multicopper oxidase family protein n=1 Tax=Okeania sp. SIO3I5 TaxID=2607805 RepID=UPI0013B927D7|nr:multicopper oxidase domain-containing protein [Okeania sp. SIO3I5]NEQ38418.1 multicopper oxidase domain-containing protein [Okeania sp. SIO3I5]
MFLVGTFISVSTFTGEAFAAEAFAGGGVADVKVQPFVNSCTLQRQNQTKQPEFQNPPFAYADTIYPNGSNDPKYRTITLDAVRDKFYLDGDGSAFADDGYDGYLYKTTYFNKDDRRVTIVRDDDVNDDNSLPGRVKEVISLIAVQTQDGEKVFGKNMVGTYTPPTIVVDPSDKENQRPNSIHLNLINNLPVNVPLAGELPPTKENLESVSQYTNIHYHGFNVSPLLGADDVLVDVPSNKTPPSLQDGGYYPDDNPAKPKYGGPITEYKMDVKIPYVHQSGLFWYHSHAHSLSDEQVRGGLSGGIIIKGSNEYYTILDEEKGIKAYTYKPPTIPPEPEKFSVRQKVMMFKDFNDILGTTGSDCLTVNGQVNPQITIRPGEVQLWRMANVGSNQYMNIALEETNTKNPAFARPNSKPNFYILARDADFVEKVVPTDSVLLPAASRVEVLVVGGYTQNRNSTYNLVSDVTTGLTEGEKWVTPGFQKKSYLLATVNVEGSQVCYRDEKGYKLGLPIDRTNCQQSREDLYTYIERQEPTSQTGRDNIPEVDKILPNPETLFDGYYPENGYKIKECKIRSEDFVNDDCLTPSTLYSDPLTKKRYFYFSQSFPKFFLKGFQQEQNISGVDGNNPPLKFQELYDANRIDKISRVGDLEEWHLINISDFAHVFHIHQLDFVVTEVTLDQNPCAGVQIQKTCTYNDYKVGKYRRLILPYDQKYWDYSDYRRCREVGSGSNKQYKCPLLPQGYRDVINLPAHSETIVRIPFVNPFITGPFVYHCHILFHEDRGMMNNLKVVNTEGYGGQDVIPQLAPISLPER